MHEAMLATRCPHCQTRFRVTTQQLLLRDGLVRCGACREIFNANSSEPTLPPTPHIEPAVALHPTVAPTPIDAATPDAADNGRMTLMDFGAWPGTTSAQGAPNMQDELDALSKAIYKKNLGANQMQRPARQRIKQPMTAKRRKTGTTASRVLYKRRAASSAVHGFGKSCFGRACRSCCCSCWAN